MKLSPTLPLQLLALAVAGCTASSPALTSDIDWNALPIRVTILQDRQEIDPEPAVGIEIRDILKEHLRPSGTEVSAAEAATSQVRYTVLLHGRDGHGQRMKKQVLIGDGWVRDANKSVQLPQRTTQHLHQIIAAALQATTE